MIYEIGSRVFLATILTLASAISQGCANDSAAGAFSGECATLASKAAEAGKRSVRGANEKWFFLTRELAHVGNADFWNKSWSEVAVNGQDPTPFILHFASLLKERGIELILVPVPPKAAIYPDKLIEGVEAGAGFSSVPYYELLEEKGVEVLNMREESAEEIVQKLLSRDSVAQTAGSGGDA